MGPEKCVAGALIGRKYRLLRRIGSGGMGAVWVARNEATLAEVALKTWHGAGGASLDETSPTAAAEERATTATRFRREAQLGALVTHRNIVQVFDMVDDDDGTLALVMELLRGEPLDRFVARCGGRLSPLEAVSAITPILSALAHAHRLGVVHRDVKPSNIFLTVDTEGNTVPKLVDFGVAKAPKSASGSELTLKGDALGTPRYMSPEQIRASSDIDGRADLFSVAVTLIELLTGSSPFQAGTAAASLVAVLERQVDPDPEVPPVLWLEIARALAKRPFERHATATEMADALREALGTTRDELTATLRALAPSQDAAGPVPAATPTQLVAESIARPSRGRRGWPMVAFGAVLVAAVVGTLGVAQRRVTRASATGSATPAAFDPASSSATFVLDPPPSAVPATSATPAPSARRDPPPPVGPRTRPPAPRPRPDPPTSKPIATTPGF